MAAVSLLYLVLRTWDAVSNPLIGALLDRTAARSRARGGKFLFWMRLAAPLLFASGTAMFLLPHRLPAAARAAAAFAVYLVYQTSYNLFSVPYGSLLSAMADDEAGRTSLSSARGFGAMIGNLIPLLFFPLLLSDPALQPGQAYGIGILACAALGLAACLLCCRWTWERGAPSSAQDGGGWREFAGALRQNRPLAAVSLMGLLYCINQYMVSTLSIYMFRDVFGALPMFSLMTLINMAGNALALAAAPRVVRRIGLERMLRGGQLLSVGLSALNFAVLVSCRSLWAYMLLSVLSGGLGGLTALMQWGMVGEAIDYNEYLTGRRTEGSVYGAFNLMRRLGQAVGVSAAVSLLEMVGYRPGAAAQSPGTVLGIEVLAILVPAVFVLLCWVVQRWLWNMTPELRARIAAWRNGGG